MNILGILKAVTYTLVLVGALNWGLVGMFHFDLVSFLFGNMSIISRIVYSIIGLGAIGYLILSLKDDTDCACCNY